MSPRSRVGAAVHELHQDSLGESVGLGVRLLVSPAAGRLRHLPPSQFQGGEEWVRARQVVAVVEQGPVTVEVRSPIDGHVAGILVRTGEPVLPGQPIVWLDQPPHRTSPPVTSREPR
jgi:biotin carboxyl carrier protein